VGLISPHKTMSETDISTREKYYNYVSFTVDCIEEEYDPVSHELNELVWESVDSSKIVLYYSYNMDILQNSDKEPQEWKHLAGETDNHKEIILAMAFDVFRQDVWEETRDRDIE